MTDKKNVEVPGQDVPGTQEQLEARKVELQQKEDLLTQKEAELTVKEAELDKREQLVKEKEHLIANAEKKSVKKAPRKGLEFSFRDEEYHFVDGAPESFRFEGKIWSQEEIIKDEEALILLIGGKSSLIEKK